MRKATLTRTSTSSQGTFGTFTLDDGTTFVSGELPNLNNQCGVSCIPTGTYTCSIYNSPKHGLVYQVMNVPSRSNVEIHPANFCGDTSKGFKSDLLGCIGLGQIKTILAGQEAIGNSKIAIAKFMSNLNNAQFTLTIIDKF